MRNWLGGLTMLIAMSAAPAFAHHPFAAEYDWKKPVTVSGTVTRFNWENPHSMLIVKGKNESGTEAEWTVELGSPGRLTQLGWNAKQLKTGDSVSVDGWLAKNGKMQMSAKSVSVGGRVLAAASSFFDEGKAPSATTRQAAATSTAHQ